MRRYYYLAYKLPSGDFDFSIRGIKAAITAENKEIFQLVNKAFKNSESCSKIWNFSNLYVGIVNPEDVKIVLNSKVCLDRNVIEFINLNKGTLFGNLEYWHSHRKILNPFFSQHALRSFIPIFNEKSKILLNNLRKMEGKGEFNVLHISNASTLETILNSMEYDVDLQNQEEEIRNVPTKNITEYTKISILRVWRIWLHPNFIFKFSSLYHRQKAAAQNSVFSFSTKILDSIKLKVKNETVESEKPKTFIRALIDPKNALKEDEILDEINTIISAAYHTSSTASSSVLMLLGMHKNVQNKVVDELRSVLGTTIDFINYDKLNELKLLEMTINEAMRLIPIGPFLFRSNSAELELTGGHILPKGTKILIPSFLLHRNKKFWGEDAEEFRPERFENLENIHPFAFIPFSRGPRMCIGWRYAMMQMKIQLAYILLKYEVDTTLKLDELDFEFNIITDIFQGFKISIKERMF